MREQWPDWTGGQLPEPLASLVATAAQTQSAHTYSSNSQVVHIHPVEGEIFMRIRARNQIDTLGERELDVAKRFAEGHSHKEIAQALGLSPSTVSNQLSAVYVNSTYRTKPNLRSCSKKFANPSARTRLIVEFDQDSRAAFPSTGHQPCRTARTLVCAIISFHRRHQHLKPDGTKGGCSPSQTDPKPFGEIQEPRSGNFQQLASCIRCPVREKPGSFS